MIMGRNSTDSIYSTYYVGITQRSNAIHDATNDSLQELNPEHLPTDSQLILIKGKLINH